MLVMLCSLWPVLLAVTVGWMACAVLAWQVVLPAAAPTFGVFKRLNVIVLAVLAALLLLLWLMDYGPGGAQCQWNVRRAAVAVQHPREEILPPRRATVSAAAATLAASPPGAGPAASKAAAAPAPVKLYFALARADLPADASGKLASTLQYLKANPDSQARLSGFHDASGDAAKNEALAYRRARAVRQWLIDGGIAGERLLMSKPASAAADGAPEEARRVEVSLRP